MQFSLFIKNALDVYFILLIVYIFATWIPKVNWEKQPWLSLKVVTGIYLDIFEKIIPGWGCILGIILFRLLQNWIVNNLLHF